jgi:hypothetical protein
MIAIACCTTERRHRGRRNLLLLGIAEDAFDDLEDWMFGAGETPTVAGLQSPSTGTP